MPKKYEAVISGIAGWFPECDNMRELENKSFTGENLVTKDPKEHEIGEFKVSVYSGHNRSASTNFDRSLFGIPTFVSKPMENAQKMALMQSFEALMDAGISLNDIRGRKDVAILMGTMLLETEGIVILKSNIGPIYSASRAYISNRISYYLGTYGPSCMFASSFTGGMHALQVATSMVESGAVKIALVGSYNKLLFPHLHLHYDLMKSMNPDGKTRSFSADAAGYSRSSSSVVMVVQRSTDALKSYGTITKVMAMTNMAHPSHFLDPLGFEEFISDFYSNVPVKTEDIAYIECDGSATKRVDAMELNSLAKVLKPKKDKPLLVSSCKSRLGHPEGASSLVSVAQALVAFKTGRIPPTIHYTAPNPDVPALLNGEIKVVTEATPLKGEYIGVTTIDMVGAFGHVLIKGNPKIQPSIPENYFPADGIPRIFLVKGRDLENLQKKLEKVVELPVNEHYYAQSHKVFKQNMSNILYAGYSIVSEDKKTSNAGPSSKNVRPIWYIFTGMGCQWHGMGAGLMKIPIIKRSLEKCAKALEPKGMDLIHILTSLDPRIFDSIINSFVGIAAMQVALVDLLEAIGVEPDGIVGHSTGELGCAYADKCVTAEEAMLLAYARGKASIDAPLIKGMMAAVGKGYADLKDNLPEDVYVACHNSATSCTLSGPAEFIEKYVTELKQKGIFAKMVNVSNIAYHTKYILPAAPYFEQYAKDVIREPKLRSKKWISSSVPQDQWDSYDAKYFSLHYFMNNLKGSVLFEEATRMVPNNAICIEIAPHGLLQAIVKGSLPTCTHVPLTNRQDSGAFTLVNALGKLFLEGLEIDLSKLYPPVEFPAPRQTDYFDVFTFHPNIDGEFTKESVNRMKADLGLINKGVKDLVLKPKDHNYILGNMIEGSPYYPRAKLLEAVLDEAKEIYKKSNIFHSAYSFKHVLFLKHLAYSSRGEINLEMLIQKGSWSFEVINGFDPLISGRIIGLPGPSTVNAYTVDDFMARQREIMIISEDEIYLYFKEIGLDLKPPFRNITRITIYDDGISAKIEWDNNVQLLMEALFRLVELYSSFRSEDPLVIEGFEELVLDLNSLPNGKSVIDVFYDDSLKHIIAPGVKMFLPKLKPHTKTSHKMKLDPVYMRSKAVSFLPHSNIESKVDFVDSVLQILNENSDQCFNGEKQDCIHLVVEENNTFCKNIARLILAQNSTSDQVKIEKVKTLPDIVKGAHPMYLVICGTGLKSEIEKLIESETPFFLISVGPSDVISNKLIPVLEHSSFSQHLTLYKQRLTKLENCEFIDVGDADKMRSLTSDQLQKTRFFIYKFTLLSEVINILQSSMKDTGMKDQRLIFVDETCPKFDPGSDFYKEQIIKNLKVNVALGGKWGSVKYSTVTQPSPAGNISSTQFGALRCESVDVQVLGVNLLTVYNPTNYKQIGVVEYSGFKDGKEVFGLGRLLEGNILETDPHLIWEKPDKWTMEAAVTTPLFYTIAYDILYLRMPEGRLCESLLIHWGHTPFSEAVIRVAHTLPNCKIFTTCSSMSQKRYILTKFPQMSDNQVILTKNKLESTFLSEIHKLTDNCRANITIDSIDNNFKLESILSTSKFGMYFLLTSYSMEDITIGMLLTLDGTAINGYNLERIFDMKTENKLSLVEMVRKGIRSQVVQPFLSHKLPSTFNHSQIADKVLEQSREELPVKCIVPLENCKNRILVPLKQTENKTCIIIGDENSIWYDLMHLVVQRSAEYVHILINTNKLSLYLRKRYEEFCRKHKLIRFSLENLNSGYNEEIWRNVLSNSPPPDLILYAKQGTDRELGTLDKVLREQRWETNLVTLWTKTSRVIERRRKDGLKGASFVTPTNRLDKSSLVQYIAHWMDTDSNIGFNENELYFHDVDHYSMEILPSNIEDVVDFTFKASKEPNLVEISTRSIPFKYARDLDPIFFFPGLNIRKSYEFAAELLYPTFMATYPLNIKSIDQLAATFSKMIAERFDNSLLCLVAEGWAGPLVLSLAKHLEHMGKACSVILLNAAPETVKQWYQQNNNIFIPHLPPDTQTKTLDTDLLTKMFDGICKSMSDKSNDEDHKEIEAGLRCLINRLEVAQNHSCSSWHFEHSVIHLFTKNDVLYESLEQLGALFKFHLINSSKHLLDEEETLLSINKLAMIENRTRTSRANPLIDSRLDPLIQKPFFF